MKSPKKLVAHISMKQHAAQAEAFLRQLANANRLMVLCALAEGEKTVGELLEIVDSSQSSLSQHLARLREAKLVSADKRGQKVYYRISNMEAKALLSVLHLIFCK